jgi:hypothetical protein
MAAMTANSAKNGTGLSDREIKILLGDQITLGFVSSRTQTEGVFA